MKLPRDAGKSERRRRSIRLQGFDYGRPGAYFVTICSQNGEPLFGEIVNGEMQINEYGLIVWNPWEDLPRHYSNLVLDAFVVMPNHVHAIIVLVDEPTVTGAGFKPAPTSDNSIALGADNRRVPSNDQLPAPTQPASDARNETDTNRLSTTVGAGLKPAPAGDGSSEGPTTGPDIPIAPTRRHGLPEIVRAFKTFSARHFNEYRQSAGVSVWQRNYYEHVIRNDGTLNRIRDYIHTNPLRWHLDGENPLARSGDDLDKWLSK